MLTPASYYLKGNRMMNDIWLYSLMPIFVNDELSLLGSTLRLVCKAFGVDSCAIRPRECGNSFGQFLVYDGGKCFLTPEYDTANMPFHIQMTCKNAFEFAEFYSAADEATLSKDAHRIFDMFCGIFYDDLMIQFAQSDAPVAVQVSDISMNFGNYPGSTNTIENIKFDIHRGQLTILMGPSGCGKSTVLNIIGGLLRPTSGSVLFSGNDICRFSRKQINDYRRNSVGFIFQNYNLIQELTARENVGISESLAKQPFRTEDALEAVGMLAKADNYPFRLSGGEQQRVCIARALVKNADLLLCDEPTGALDTVNSKNIMTILQREAHRQNAAVVVVTHNPDFEAIADHYIEMKNGRIIIDDYRPFPFEAEQIL